MSATKLNAGIIVEGKIAELAISKSYSNFVFIKMDTVQSKIPCATNGSWHFTLPLNTDQEKSMYSAILAAHMAGKTIRLDGFTPGVFSEFGSIESLSTFTLK